MSTIKSTVLLCFVFIGIVLVMFVISVLRVPQLSVEEMRSKGVFLLPTPRDIAAFKLTDHMGKTFDRSSINGRWSFVFFGFVSCPDVCPTSMSVLGSVDRQLQASNPELAEQFQGILVSVDPERDSTENLAKYATAFSPRFLGVTGPREDLVGLTTQVNVAFAKVPLTEPPPPKVLLLMSQPMLIPSITQAISSLSIPGATITDSLSCHMTPRPLGSLSKH